MSNKKSALICLVLSIFMVGGFVACSSNEEKNENDIIQEEGQVPEEESLIIGLVTEEGGVDDKSFNQNTDKGIKRAVEDFGVTYYVIESEDQNEYKDNIESLINQGTDLVFAVGTELGDTLAQIARANEDSEFVSIDSIIDEPNVQSIIFNENEGAFLVGVIAAEMTKENKIGFIGGKDIESINKFEAGFTAGVLSVNSEAGKVLLERETVKYADAFTDTNRVYELSKELYDDGCDIIFHVAGGAGIGLFSAAQEMRDAGEEVWAIGVDMDQAEVMPEYEDVILTSMIKKVDVGAYDAIESLVNGIFEGGKVVELGVQEGGVDIAESTSNNVPEDVLHLVEDYKNAIESKKVRIPISIDELKNFEYIDLKYENAD